MARSSLGDCGLLTRGCFEIANFYALGIAVTGQGAAVTLNAVANDTDANGDALLITIDSQPQHGSAMVQNGQIVYTPTAGYTGVDSFTYIISDGKGGTATATVTVTVGGQGGGRTIYLPVIQR